MKILRRVKVWFTSPVRVGDSRFNAIFVGLALGLGVGGMVLALVYWDWLQVGVDNPESNSATLRNVGLLIGGVVALVLALWRGIVAGHQADAAQRQAKVAQGQIELGQQGFLNERYQKGAEMLGDSVLSVRLGGIYALQRLAEEYPEQYYLQIMDLLCAFVRHPTEDKVMEKGQKDRRTKLREDVQTIMEIVRKRGEHLIALEKENDFRLNFQDADLMYVNIWSTDLSRANFQGANLAMARLIEVNLSGARLSGVNLSRSRLTRANLSHTEIHLANMFNAILIDADLTGARFDRANLTAAQLDGAKISEAHLVGTYLTNASLKRSDLSETFMRDVKLVNADLSDAILKNTYIAGVEFYDTHECADTDECGITHECFNYDMWNDTGRCYDENQCHSAHREIGNKKPARGLTQKQLDEAEVDPRDTPPRLDGFVMDAETGEPLVWRG